MFRNLCMLRKNILMSRIIYSSYTVRANLSCTPKYRVKTSDATVGEVTVTDINIQDMAKGDLEFSRNFLVSLDKTVFSPVPAPDDGGKSEAVIESDTPAVSESPAVEGGGGGSMSILDRDGLPIVPIEIDGWKNALDDEGPTVQNPGEQPMDIGNDIEYKKQQMLVVPETREGQFEYKGIKVKLPDSASKDIGTYRFRRDPEDLETVADDMRVVKFDKKQ